MLINKKEKIFEEKYRPQQLSDMILPDTTRGKIQSWINDNDLPHLLLSSTVPGTGKSTLADVLINEMEYEALWINASIKNGVDVLRSEISNWSDTVSADGEPKFVILDEADNLTDATQKSLRGFIEEFSSNIRFILTCNYKNRLIEPLQQRLVCIDFDMIVSKPENKKSLLQQLAKRIVYICKNEGIEYDINDVKELVQAGFPSFRETVKSVKGNLIDGKLVIEDGVTETSALNTRVIQAVKEKQFTDMRKDVLIMPDCGGFYSWFFKNINKFLDNNQQPNAIITIAKYQNMSGAGCRDQQLNLTACMIEIIGLNLVWK